MLFAIGLPTRGLFYREGKTKFISGFRLIYIIIIHINLYNNNTYYYRNEESSYPKKGEKIAVDGEKENNEYNFR